LLWVLFACGLARASDLSLVGGKIYPSPTEQAIENGSILVHDGGILAFGPSAAVKVSFSCNVCPAFQRRHTSFFCAAESPNRSPALLNTTFENSFIPNGVASTV